MELVKKLSYCKEFNEITYLLHNVPLQVINPLRKIILSNIMNAGMNQKNVAIIRNNTVVSDEILAHRISLIPVKSRKECELVLNVINSDEEEIFVTSDNFAAIEGVTVAKEVIICKLKKGEELQLTAKVTMDIAQNGGVGYRPVETAYFSKMKAIYTDCKKTQEKVSEFFSTSDIQMYYEDKRICPRKNKYKCIGMCSNMNSLDQREITNYLKLPQNALIIEPLSATYAFTVESLLISPRTIMRCAIKILTRKLDKLLSAKFEYITQRCDESKIKIEMEMYGQNFATLQTFAYFLKKYPQVSFCSYSKVSPLAKMTKFIVTLDATARESEKKIMKDSAIDAFKKASGLLDSLLAKV